MTNILTVDGGGGFVEADHASVTKALAIASDGSLTEIAATGTRKVIAIDASGGLTEVSVTFDGAPPADTLFVPTPTWTF